MMSNSDARKRAAEKAAADERAGDVEALASVLDRHVTDAAFESGCRLSCGYDGDDLTWHMASAVLASDWLAARDARLIAEAERRVREQIAQEIEAECDHPFTESCRGCRGLRRAARIARAAQIGEVRP